MIFSPWPSARRIYLITEAGSWHLLGDVFFVDRAFKHARCDCNSPAPGVIWKDNEKKFFSIWISWKWQDLKLKALLYWRFIEGRTRSYLTYWHLWKVFEKNHTNWSILLQRFNYSADVSNTWRTGRWIRARWSCAGVPPHQRIKSCCGLMKILKIVGPS